MKAKWRWLALALILLTPALRAGADPADRPAVYYFFENYCGSCHPETEFADEFRRLTGRALTDYRYEYANVADAAGRERYRQVLEAQSVPAEQQLLPMAIVDGRVYAGSRALSEALPRAFAESPDDRRSLIYYVYAPACESCQKVNQEISKLGDFVPVKRGGYAFESPLTVRKINIYEEFGAAQALFERYQVPEAERVAPIVFMGTRYHSGISSILPALRYALPEGGAIGTPLLAEESGPAARPVNWAGIAAAGLFAGFNPCALSMLLFFLALLIGANVPVGRLAALFLGAKFLTYLMIGALLHRLFSALNLALLPTVTKIALTALCAVLAALNLRDAWAAKRERYGEIKNQLPAGFRRFLHGRIERTVRGAGPWLGASVCALGVVVAGGEFLCAGQIYLASLIAQAEAGMGFWRTLPMLAAFSLTFLLPSAALSVLVIRGREVFDVSEWVRSRMPLIKLATALMLVAVCLYAWLMK